MMMMKAALHIFLFLACYATFVDSLSINPRTQSRLVSFTLNGKKRRDFLATTLLPFVVASPSLAAAHAVDSRAISTLRLNSSNDKAGLKLKDVVIGTPPRTVVAVEQVLSNGLAAKAGIQQGTIIQEYNSAKDVADRIKNGPYPVELQFYNLAAGGDAIGDFGKPLVTAQDALQVAKSTSAADETATDTTPKQQEYTIRVLKQAPDTCQLQSRRGDVLEINYQARFGKPNGLVYDSSAQRGTGQPYQFVLGSGDMIPGVDNGLNGMCPGEIRLLEIPPALGYGPRASKLFDIPSQSPLFWTVELVSVNSVRAGDTRDREELEGRAAW